MSRGKQKFFPGSMSWDMSRQRKIHIPKLYYSNIGNTSTESFGISSRQDMVELLTAFPHHKQGAMHIYRFGMFWIVLVSLLFLCLFLKSHSLIVYVYFLIVYLVAHPT